MIYNPVKRTPKRDVATFEVANCDLKHRRGTGLWPPYPRSINSNCTSRMKSCALVTTPNA